MRNDYCYPNTDILKNKLNIQDESKLLKCEISLTSTRLSELQRNPIKGNFDFEHLCNIHKFIFQDLYDWAGKPRTVDIGKGNLFCRPQFINDYANDIFSKYYKDCNDSKNNPSEFTRILAKHYSDVNALHPFREGNGRTQREFARELCLSCGYDFDLTQTAHKDMLAASIKSFNGDTEALEQIFAKNVTPILSYNKLNKKLKNTIQILSADDIITNDSEKSCSEYDISN